MLVGEAAPAARVLVGVRGEDSEDGLDLALI